MIQPSTYTHTPLHTHTHQYTDTRQYTHKTACTPRILSVFIICKRHAACSSQTHTHTVRVVEKDQEEGRERGERGARDGRERGERGAREGSERGAREGSERGAREGSERGAREASPNEGWERTAPGPASPTLHSSYCCVIDG